jgi:diguanylate cyclase (GGDEF)-like protein/PAS domain S-box-containing protein
MGFLLGEALLMTSVHIPINEKSRLEALRRYQIIDGELNQVIDDLIFLAAQSCCAPFALVSFVDSDRVWHISKVGISWDELDRESSFCSWTINAPAIFVIEDAIIDSRFSHSPLVKGEPQVRSYAGVPLLTPEGYAIGALSVMDRASRKFSQAEAHCLQTLAAAIISHIELRRKNAMLDRALADRHRLEEMLRVSNKMLKRVEQRNVELSQSYNQLKNQISEREQALESLAASEERYSLVARSANDGLWDWNLQTNEIHFCPRWKAMLGYEESEVGSHVDEWFTRIHPEDFEQFHAEIVAHLLGLTPQFQSEHRLRGREGNYVWVLSRGLAVWDTNGNVYRMAGAITDITRQKEAENQLLHNTFHDQITGLPNRGLFLYKLKRLIDRSHLREDYLFAVLLIDLDRFKVISDSLGHEVGDELLAVIARRLESAIRPGDLAARMDSDEFAVILDNLKHISDATDLAAKIQSDLAAPFDIEGQEIFITASIGIALNLSSEEKPEDFLRHADAALERAKEQGLGGLEIFDKGVHAETVEMLQLETDLRRALARNEFRVYYQPIISVEDWRIAGFEALLRWEHPQLGFIAPLQFIPVAEESGLIIPIGQWVLGEACRQLREWQDDFPSEPPLTVSVNLSGKQFAQPDLIDKIEEMLTKTNLEARSLKIEITESAIVENIEAATATLKRLKEFGIKVSLDDFGTGYSSLSYLHRFPVDTLKIDRSFVTRMSLPKNSEIVRTIVSLASNLGMDVVAEGVETGEQVIQLTGMNCEYMQGYLISRPIDAKAARTLIEETNMRSGRRAGAA